MPILQHNPARFLLSLNGQPSLLFPSFKSLFSIFRMGSPNAQLPALGTAPYRGLLGRVVAHGVHEHRMLIVCMRECQLKSFVIADLGDCNRTVAESDPKSVIINSLQTMYKTIP